MLIHTYNYSFCYLLSKTFHLIINNCPILDLNMRSTYILTTILFLSYIPFNLASPPETDALSILAFVLKADIHNKLHYTVNTDTTPCQWQGVHCQSDGTVVRFLLENLSLTGVFAPDTLTRLHQLRVLSLYNNSLSGPIPDLSGLVNLKILFLNYNFFSGVIPPSIASLHRLRTLDLSHNILSGIIPIDITNLSRLTYLRLDSNRLIGSIPPLNQTYLNIFNVSFNALTGPVPVTPTLSKFSTSSFSPNAGLCGQIVRTECSSITPFFGKSSTKTPSFSLLPPPPAVLLGQTMNFKNSYNKKHKRLAIIIGIPVSLIVIISSITTCILMSVSKNKNKLNDIMSTSDMMEVAAVTDAAAADAAELVRRMEETEELEEKVRKLQQGIDKGKSGKLVFCSGETQVYTVEHLMRAKAEMVGRGCLGVTYKAEVETGVIVCVKRLDVGRLVGTTKEMFERHMEVVGGLRHPNLVPLRAYFQARDERLLVYDYCANGSLFTLVHGSTSSAKPMQWTSCLKIAEDIAQGLSYIHQAWRLVHGNLKSSNVLLGSDFEACLSDYCLSTLSQHPPDCHSSAYEPPETCRLNHQPTAKSDVYSFGVILLELLTGKPAPVHPHFGPDDMVNWVRSVRENDGGDVDHSRLMMLVEVAVVCRVSSPEQRPTMWEVLKMIQEIKDATKEAAGTSSTEGSILVVEKNM
ncbi:putative protein kinase RLK-Pelle-LRR-III family [Helianthus debilis subsp. tardiflorus]